MAREIEQIINGRLVVARPRRSEIEVDVYSAAVKDPEQLVAELGYPKALGTYLAMRQGELEADSFAAQEKREKEET